MVECDLYGIDAALRGLHFSELVTAEQVKRENIVKLWTKRYPDGKYTDSHAQERRDKEDEK